MIHQFLKAKSIKIAFFLLKMTVNSPIKIVHSQIMIIIPLCKVNIITQRLMDSPSQNPTPFETTTV